MQITFTFPDATSWPPQQWGCFTAATNPGSASWFAADRIRVIDPGNGFGIGTLQKCQPSFPTLPQGGLTLVAFAGAGSIGLSWSFHDQANNVTFAMLVNPNSVNELQITSSLGDNVFLNPGLAPGDKFVFDVQWAAGTYTLTIIQNGVNRTQLVKALAAQPVVTSQGFSTSSAGGGGQPGSSTDFGDLSFTLINGSGGNPPSSIQYNGQPLNSSVQDEPIEGDV